MHVVCPGCQAVNRIPEERLTQNPVCGRCHKDLFTRTPITLDAASFDKHLSRCNLPLLVDFWAPWCGPCRTMAPQFERAAAELEPHVRPVKVNTEEQTVLAGRYAIRSIPTIALFRQGREVARQAGAMGAADIVRWARSNLV